MDAAPFQELLRDMNDVELLINTRPQLAHYTSTATLEKILQTEAFLLSNPLFMNDLEEVRFGFSLGQRLFVEKSQDIQRACGTLQRYGALKHAFEYYCSEFDEKHALDIYLLCLSEHVKADEQGRLSMWRAYGGRGNGAALVFNTDHFGVHEESPLLFAKVRYGSVQSRVADLTAKFMKWCQVLQSTNVPDNDIHIAAYWLLMLVKFFALVTKHKGFEEEQEWRLIYSAEHDLKGFYTKNRTYLITDRGVEPKLTFPIKALPVAEAPQWTFDKILEKIILGPSISSPLSKSAVVRMLETLGKANLIDRVVASGIPLRPNS